MWKITLVGNQKPENTQVKVLLFQLRFAQGVRLTFSHFTIGIMQVSVAGCNVHSQDSGHQHTCCLSALGDRRIRNLNFEFSVKEETPKYFDCGYISREVTAYAAVISPVCTPDEATQHTRERKDITPTS